MKNLFLLSILLCLSLSGSAQEFSSGEVNFFIGARDLPPALTKLKPLLPEGHFELTDPDIFQKNQKREIHMLGLVERERRHRESIADYDTPSFYKHKKEGSLQISDNVHLYNRGSNYDYYTGKLKNPVYKEMEAHLFNDFYRMQYNRNRPSSSPYFSPFRR